MLKQNVRWILGFMNSLSEIAKFEQNTMDYGKKQAPSCLPEKDTAI